MRHREAEFHVVDGQRPHRGRAVADHAEVGTQNGEAVVHAVDPVVDRRGGRATMGDVLADARVGVARRQGSVPWVGAAEPGETGCLVVNPQAGDGGREQVEQPVEGVRQRTRGEPWVKAHRPQAGPGARRVDRGQGGGGGARRRGIRIRWRGRDPIAIDCSVRPR